MFVLWIVSSFAYWSLALWPLALLTMVLHHASLLNLGPLALRALAFWTCVLVSRTLAHWPMVLLRFHSWPVWPWMGACWLFAHWLAICPLVLRPSDPLALHACVLALGTLSLALGPLAHGPLVLN